MAIIRGNKEEKLGGVQASESNLWDDPFGAPAVAPAVETPINEAPTFSEPVVTTPVGVVMEAQIAAAANGSDAIAQDINDIIAQIQRDPNIDLNNLRITDPSVFKIAEEAKARALETSVTAKQESDRSLEMITGALTGVATASVAMGSADVFDDFFTGLTKEQSIYVKQEVAPVAAQMAKYPGQGKDFPDITSVLDGRVDDLPELPTIEKPLAIPTKESPSMMRSLKNA